MSTKRVLLVLLVCASPFVGLTLAAMLMAWLHALFTPSAGGAEVVAFFFGTASVIAAVTASIGLAIEMWSDKESEQ